MIPDPRDTPTLSVEEGGKLLSLGRSASYTAASRYLATGGAEGLPVIPLGRRLVVPTVKILALLGQDVDPEPVLEQTRDEGPTQALATDYLVTPTTTPPQRGGRHGGS